MKKVTTRRHIAAPPAVIWSLLTDTSALTQDGTGIIRIDGVIAADTRFKLVSQVAPNRAFSLHVAEFQPPLRMVWQSGMPLGLFHGRRVFELSPDGSGTDFLMEETFGGLLLPLIWRSMPDLQPSFDSFANAIARMAERKET